MFDGRHTAEHLYTVIKEFFPLKKVFWVVHDEAANMVAAGRQLHEEINCESTVCAAHMLQTCLHHSFDSSQQIQSYLLERGSWLDISITVRWLQKLCIHIS